MSNNILVWDAPVPKAIERLIADRINYHFGPYEYLIIGKSGGSISREESAEITFNKLKEWAERQGAEARIIKRTYNKYGTLQFLTVEITDPAARHIDRILDQYR
jgi:hypothetical protein